MYRNVFTILIILSSMSTMCFTADISKEELIIQVNRARMDIKSGEIQAEISTEFAAKKTEEEIQALIKKNIEDELKSYTPHENVDKETFEKEYLIPNANYHANWYRQHTDVDHITTLFQIIEPDTPALPELYQYKLTMLKEPGYSLNSEKAQNHHVNEMIFTVYDGNTQVRNGIGNFVSSSGSIELEDSDVWYGYVPYSLFGRSYYQVPTDAQLLGKEIIDNAECHVLEFENIDKWNNKQKFKIWVDVSKNYGIRKIVYFRGVDTDKIFYQIEYKDFQRFKQVWFPKIKTETFYNKENKLESHMTIKIISLDLDVDFPKDFFTVDRELYSN